MRLGVLNQDLGIMVVDGIDDISYLQMEEIKSQLPDGKHLDSLAFFYDHDKDCIILNKGHALYEFYAEIIQVYLTLSEVERTEIKEKAPTYTIMEALRILDNIINYRFLKVGVLV